MLDVDDGRVFGTGRRQILDRDLITHKCSTTQVSRLIARRQESGNWHCIGIDLASHLGELDADADAVHVLIEVRREAAANDGTQHNNSRIATENAAPQAVWTST